MSALKERLYHREDGAGMVEYALLVALIGVLLIVALNGLRGGIDETFQDAEDQLRGVAEVTVA